MRLILTTIIILFTASLCHAQTVIEGEVSGEWTSEDSPYVIIDSTWIEEGESLILTPGTEIQFEEDQGLYIYGRLRTESEWNEDWIRIKMAPDVQHWMGIRFYGRNVVEFNNTNIECPDTAIFLDERCRLTLNYSQIEAEITCITQHVFSEQREWQLEFNDSHISGGSNINTGGGQIIAVNTKFFLGRGYPDDEPGLRAYLIELKDCYVNGGTSGGVNGPTVKIDNCEFYGPEGSSTIVRVPGDLGFIKDSFIDGSLVIGDAPSGTVKVVENNVVSRDLSISGPALITNCNVRGDLDIGGEEDVSMRGCELSKSVIINQNVASVKIDSCAFIYGSGNPTNLFSSNCIGSVEITRSVILSENVEFRLDSAPLLDHNTFVFDGSINGSISAGRRSKWHNNILYNLEPEEPLFDNFELPDLVEYNCIWGFEVLNSDHRNPVYYEDLDSSNINSDPKIDWFGLSPLLSYDSPCIDRGDPDALDDPDGTRSDIGAWAFYQWNNSVEELERIFQPQRLTVEAYPNPFNSHLSIDHAANLPVQVSVYDPLGRVVKSGRYNQRHINLSFDGSHLPTGTYFLYINDGRQDYVQQLTLLK